MSANGMRGPLPEGYKAPLVPGAETRPVPRPPKDLVEEEMLEEWRVYWTSEVGAVAADVDTPTVARLFLYRQEWLQLARSYMTMSNDEKITIGSRNEDAIRLHPFGKQLRDLETIIGKLEDKLGISPMARARLGIEIGQASLTWQEVARRAKGNSEVNPAIGTGTQRLSLPVAEADDDEIVVE